MKIFSVLAMVSLVCGCSENYPKFRHKQKVIVSDSCFTADARFFGCSNVGVVFSYSNDPFLEISYTVDLKCEPIRKSLLSVECREDQIQPILCGEKC